MQIRISMACGKFLQSEPSLSLCLSLLSPLLPMHVEEMRWGTWWWNEERVQSLWLILRVTERCCQRVTSCLNLLYWAGVQPELTLPWIPVPCCRSEPLNPAGRWASECLPLFRGTRAVLCHEELQPLLAAPSPLCRNVLQARCSPSLSHITGCYHISHIQGTLAPSYTCTIWGSLDGDASPVETNVALKFRTVTNPDNNEAAEVA